MYLKNIKISNFRSLVDVNVDLKNYTALVGLNDSGKSNLFRALNLFFNNETDHGKKLDFHNDFCQKAIVRAKKAKEIIIEIELSPPTNYKNRESIIWKKIFRADQNGPYSEELSAKDNKTFGKGSKNADWAKKIVFEYVPAIRGPSYFSILKRRLYDTLAATIAPKLQITSDAFLSGLRSELSSIESNAKNILNLSTEFALPADLGGLFEVLDFDATDSDTRTKLQNRGDGIQSQHIPIILKFLAEQRRKNSVKGKSQIETIWGFEEPENNLELSKQIETADLFKSYSKDIQLIISTHSAAFYGKAAENGQILSAQRKNGLTQFFNNKSIGSVDQELGLIHFLQPYIKKAQDDKERELINNKAITILNNKAALFVEGITDKMILDAIYKKLGLTLNFEICSVDAQSGGVNWVVGRCKARLALNDLKSKTAGLFDGDDAGKQGIKEINTNCVTAQQTSRYKSFQIEKNIADKTKIKKIIISGLQIPIGIEELYGFQAWKYALSKNWLVSRSSDLISSNAKILESSRAPDEIFKEKINDNEAMIFINYKIDWNKKKLFAKHMVDNVIPTTPSASLELLAKNIHKYFQ